MRIPLYRTHENGQAFVQHKSLRPYKSQGRWYLGTVDSPESLRKYKEFVRRLLANETVDSLLQESENPSPKSLVEIAIEFLEWSEARHKRKQFLAYRRAVKLLLENKKFGTLYAHQFLPAKLIEFQESLIAAEYNRQKGNEAEKQTYCRRYVNRNVSKVRKMFKWATSRSLIPPSIYHGLLAVDPVEQGREDVREAPKVLPAKKHMADAVLPFLPPTIAAMVQVQYFCGMRPQDVCKIRRRDIDMSGEIWLYHPPSHKNEWRGQVLTKAIPRVAQAIIKPFFATESAKYLFSPIDAMEWIREQRRLKSPTKGRKSNWAIKAMPKRQPGEKYTTHSYRNALDAGFRRAAKEGVEVERFTPNQLRHAIATEVSKFLGEQSAQRWLGQECLETTAIYVERDRAELIEIAKKLDERWAS